MIIQSAKHMFGLRGFNRAGIDLIVENSTISKQTFYNYFTSKENLIKLTLENVIEEEKVSLFSHIEKFDGKNSKLKAYYDWHVNEHEKNKLTGSLVLVAAIELSNHKDINKVLNDYSEWKLSILNIILKKIDKVKINIIIGLLNNALLPDSIMNYKQKWSDIEYILDL